MMEGRTTRWPVPEFRKRQFLVCVKGNGVDRSASENKCCMNGLEKDDKFE